MICPVCFPYLFTSEDASRFLDDEMPLEYSHLCYKCKAITETYDKQITKILIIRHNLVISINTKEHTASINGKDKKYNSFKDIRKIVSFYDLFI